MNEANPDTVRLEGSPPPEPPMATVGAQVGRYKLVQNIGEGGFGNVYLADQVEPIRRKVAVKIIKLGLDTGQFIARFEAERQALAMMDHPCIAKVLDAGATATGRPYLVMELVRGLPINEYCDKQRLSIRERVALFVHVCSAVQHAHQKGIIHRDIKPTNILVTIQEGEPLPKVIDFGVAKAVQQPLTDKTMFTQVGQFIGTPKYMSPEQADRGALDVDTRSDIYSLGAVLYELLAGKTPFDFSALAEPRMDEIRRIIVEDEPRRPSARFDSLRDDRTSIAQRRGCEPGKLVGLLRGELDWIVLKALEKDRTRRYESAAAMAADLRRYLSDETVSASPPSAAYRLRKLIRRHRAAAWLATAILLGACGTASGLLWAYGARARMATAEALQARAAGALAEQRTRELETVIEFQASMLNAIDGASTGRAFFDQLREHARRTLSDQGVDGAAIEEAVGPLEKVLASTNATDVAMAVIQSQILEKAEKAIDERFKGRPLIRAALQQHLAEVLVNHHLFEASERLTESAYNLRLAELGANHPDTLDSLCGKADLLLQRGDYPGAADLYRAASAGFIAAGDPRAVEAKAGLAAALFEQGRFSDAEGLLREVYSARLSSLGPDDAKTLTALSSLGSALLAQGKMSEAADISHQVLATAERTAGPEAPITLTAMHNTAFILQSLGRHREAEPIYRRKLEACERVLGTNHADTLVAANNLAASLREQGKLDESEKYFRMALEGERRTLGPDHPSVFVTLNNLASLLQSQGKLSEVEILLREALEGLERSVGLDHPDAIVVCGNLIWTLVKLDRAAEAEAMAADAVARGRRAFGENHWLFGVTLSKHALALQKLGKFAETEPELVRAGHVVCAALGSDHEHTRNVESMLKTFYREWHEADPTAGHGRKVDVTRTCGDASRPSP